MSTAGHLVRRFLGSLRPGGPGRADREWAQDQLLPAEQPLWASMPAADRRHSVGVARRVAAQPKIESCARGEQRSVLAAALLHDVGKTVAGLSTVGRVGATLIVAWLGRERIGSWTAGRGLRRRIGLYSEHPQLGADLLELAGSAPLTVAWTREHHLPAEAWTVPADMGAILKAADDD